MDTWSVVTTVLASEFHVNHFVNYYLKLGAKKVYVFFDDESTSKFDEALLKKGLEVFYCTQDYWKNLPELSPYKKVSSRPQNIEKRQHLNMLYARSIMKSDWILHVDIDEYVYARRSVSSILSVLPENVFSVQLKTLEVIYDSLPDEGQEFNTRFFKRFMPHKQIVKDIFGEISEFTHGGFWGVAAGKSFIRKSPEIWKMTVHRPLPVDKSLIAGFESSLMELLHFEGLSVSEFSRKMKGRIKRIDTGSTLALSSRLAARATYVKKFYEDNKDYDFIELYKKFYVLDPERMKKAIDMGWVVELDWQKSNVTGVNFNPIDKSRSVSNFQGDLVRTNGNKYLSYDIERKIVCAVSSSTLVSDDRHIPLKVLNYDSFAILFFENDGVYYVSDKKCGVGQSFDKCLKFECHKNALGISLFCDGHYLCVDGSKVTIDRVKASHWERVFIQRVYPQLPMGS